MNKKEYNKLINDIQKHLADLCKDDRVKYHINPVVEIAKRMAKDLDADIEIVEIAAYMHDITKITGERKDHHITGAIYTQEFLKNYNIEEDKVNRIMDCIKSHRGNSEFPRDTIEQKIIATADAVAHIEHPLTLFYAWYGRRNCSIDDGADGILKKLRKSWDKIEFDYIKEQEKEKYEALIKMLEDR